MTAHSRIGASSMHRWSACPGSVVLSEGIESRSSDDAKLGTAAHALAEACLNQGLDAADFRGWTIRLVEGEDPVLIPAEANRGE